MSFRAFLLGAAALAAASAHATDSQERMRSDMVRARDFCRTTAIVIAADIAATTDRTQLVGLNEERTRNLRCADTVSIWLHNYDVTGKLPKEMQ